MAGTRWAVVGPGRIAEKFLAAVVGDTEHPDGGGAVVAVASRSRDRARRWADEHGVARAHAGIDELAADDEVDAWYVASPHVAHVDTVVAAAAAGVAVLVEKPFGVTAAGVERAQAACRSAGVALVEAMWTRFLPAHDQVRRWLAQGVIGEVRHLDARLGFVARRDLHDRLLNPALAGGAVLDTGVYPLALAGMVFGGVAPDDFVVRGHVGPTGVDEQALMLATWAGGAGATLTATLMAHVERSAEIAGSEGRIEIEAPFHGATTVRRWGADGAQETVTSPHDVNGFEYQVREVHRLLRDGTTESPRMSWADSLALARQMDDARRQLGVVLPADAADPPI